MLLQQEKQQIFLKCDFFLYAFAFLGATASVETVKSKNEREERKAQDFSLWSAVNNPFAVNTRILQPRPWPHHGDNLSGSIYNIFCIADKKCQRDLAGKFAAMLSASLVCCSVNLETYKSAFRDQAFNSNLVLLWYHYI